MVTNQKRVITIHQSPAEMETARYRYAASLDPAQGLRETVQLILRVYNLTRGQLKKRGYPTRITFANTE